MNNLQAYPRQGMKTKTIKQIIRKKMDEWLATIEDEELRKDVAGGIIVTGGCIASMLLGEKVNDFDVYLRSKELASRLAKYYVPKFGAVGEDGRTYVKGNKGIRCPIWVEETDERVKIVIKSVGIADDSEKEKEYKYFEGQPDEQAQGYVAEVMRDPGDITEAYEQTEEAALEDEDKKYRPIFMSTNAITLSNKLQIILRFFGEPDEIHGNYDFAHCTNYWKSWGEDSLTLRPEALEALLARELRYVGSKYPICSIIRMRKFIIRGWRINAGQILKMVMQLSELDLKDPAVLEEQLTGVDVAYFIQVIERCKEKDPNKINTAYLIEIIDRMF